MSIHNLFDLYAAVQEGVLFNLYHCYQILTELNGEVERIQLSGGILRSGRWTQMCADIFGRDLEVESLEHASLHGGAVLAMEVLGLIDDARDYKPCINRVVTPDRTKEKLYAQEPGLLLRERSLMPRLPFTKCDTLFVDEIGKNISGPGLEPYDSEMILRAGKLKVISRLWMPLFTQGSKKSRLPVLKCGEKHWELLEQAGLERELLSVPRAFK